MRLPTPGPAVSRPFSAAIRAILSLICSEEGRQRFSKAYRVGRFCSCCRPSVGICGAERTQTTPNQLASISRDRRRSRERGKRLTRRASFGWSPNGVPPIGRTQDGSFPLHLTSSHPSSPTFPPLLPLTTFLSILVTIISTTSTTTQALSRSHSFPLPLWHAQHPAYHSSLRAVGSRIVRPSSSFVLDGDGERNGSCGEGVRSVGDEGD